MTGRESLSRVWTEMPHVQPVEGREVIGTFEADYNRWVTRFTHLEESEVEAPSNDVAGFFEVRYRVPPHGADNSGECDVVSFDDLARAGSNIRREY